MRNAQKVQSAGNRKQREKFGKGREEGIGSEMNTKEVSNAFLWCMGLTYLWAFASLYYQVPGMSICFCVLTGLSWIGKLGSGIFGPRLYSLMATRILYYLGDGIRDAFAAVSASPVVSVVPRSQAVMIAKPFENSKPKIDENINAGLYGDQGVLPIRSQLDCEDDLTTCAFSGRKPTGLHLIRHWTGLSPQGNRFVENGHSSFRCFMILASTEAVQMKSIILHSRQPTYLDPSLLLSTKSGNGIS